MHMYMLHASAALNQEGLEYVLAAGAVTHRVDASERECTHVGMAAGNSDANEAATLAVMHCVRQATLAAIADKERCACSLTTPLGHNLSAGHFQADL